jgi:hypothetical protein
MMEPHSNPPAKGPLYEYIIRNKVARRRLGLPDNMRDQPGDVLSAITKEPQLVHLADWSERDLCTVQQMVQDDVVEQPRLVDTTVFDPFPKINRLFLDKRRIRKRLARLTFENVYFACSGGHFALFSQGALDLRSTGIPGPRMLDDIRNGNVRSFRELNYCCDRFSPDNPAHFIGDHLSRAVIFRERLGVDEQTLAFAETPTPLCGVMRDAFVPEAQVVGLDEVVHVERLSMLTSALEGTPTSHPFWFLDAHIIEDVCRVATDLVADRGPPTGGVVYLNRLKMPRRRLINEPELIAELEARGAVSVEMGDLDARTQMRLMHDADVVIAPHGAALVNMIAARPGTGILEMFSSGRGTLAFAGIARARGLDYHPLVGRAVELPAPAPQPDPIPPGTVAAKPPDSPWEIDIPAVLSALGTFEKRPG